MQAIVDIPDELAKLLANNETELSRAALEALALQGIGRGKLTVTEGRLLLGISSRFEMDGFLAQHGVEFEMTAEELEQDTRNALAFAIR